MNLPIEFEEKMQDLWGIPKLFKMKERRYELRY